MGIPLIILYNFMDFIPKNLHILTIQPLENTGRLPLDILAETPWRTREAARNAGAKKFFNGKLCDYGHMSDRYVSTGSCIECLASRSKIHLTLGVRRGHALDMVPNCLVGKMDENFCAACPKLFKCEGVKVREPLIRATLAFPSPDPLRLRHATLQRTRVFVPEEPCSRCGYRGWHSTVGKVCGVCEVRRRIARTGEIPNPAKWIPGMTPADLAALDDDADPAWEHKLAQAERKEG
jgi:hypothetical protein